MAAASNEQTQMVMDGGVRPHSELFRNLYNACKSAKASNDDIYERMGGAAWNDSRNDVPHKAVNQDYFSYDTAISAFIALVEGTLGQQGKPSAGDFAAQWPVIQKLCVRAP